MKRAARKRSAKRGAKRRARRTSPFARRGLMFVLSSPSGAGKTTLSRMLLNSDPSVELSISVTTRPRRPSEIRGRHYHFIDDARFEAMVARSELLEWAEVFGYRYGTPKKAVQRALAAGRDVLFDIDWQGTQQLREKARADLVSVFLLPPSIAELKRRLKSRAQDSEATIRRRLTEAKEEMSHWPEYDYIVINRDIDRAYTELRAILAAERLKRERQTKLSAFVRSLQDDL